MTKKESKNKPASTIPFVFKANKRKVKGVTKWRYSVSTPDGRVVKAPRGVNYTRSSDAFRGAKRAFNATTTGVCYMNGVAHPFKRA